MYFMVDVSLFASKKKRNIRPSATMIAWGITAGDLYGIAKKYGQNVSAIFIGHFKKQLRCFISHFALVFFWLFLHSFLFFFWFFYFLQDMRNAKVVSFENHVRYPGSTIHVSLQEGRWWNEFGVPRNGELRWGTLWLLHWSVC